MVAKSSPSHYPCRGNPRASLFAKFKMTESDEEVDVETFPMANKFLIYEMGLEEIRRTAGTYICRSCGKGI